MWLVEPTPSASACTASARNDGRYHRYVLGELPEAERVALEDEYWRRPLVWAAGLAAAALAGALLFQLTRLQGARVVSLVRLTLQLPASVAAQVHRASIQTPEGREVWARSGLRAEPTGGGPAVVLAVPASALSPGHHLVVVSSEDGAPLAEYVMEVVRP